MTNHPRFTESHDSAARSVGYEGAREGREGYQFVDVTDMMGKEGKHVCQ